MYENDAEPEIVSLGHSPSSRWRFDESVASCFSDMLKRSIPDYEGMRESCLDVGSAFVKPKTDILDVGCSRGDALEPFVKRFGCHNRFVGLEQSPSMIKHARNRFLGYPENGDGAVNLYDHDLRSPWFPSFLPSLTLCVLTLQFLPIPTRRFVLSSIHGQTRHGGAVLVVEKIVGATRKSDDFLVSRYHAMKEANGYSREEIEAKRRSLENVMAPTTAACNEDMLRDAGFRDVECFWRRLNFAAFVAVRTS